MFLPVILLPLGVHGTVEIASAVAEFYSVSSNARLAV